MAVETLQPWDLKVFLRSDPPIKGCELNPRYHQKLISFVFPFRPIYANTSMAVETLQPWDLKVFLRNDPPIKGCELNPWYHVLIKGSLSHARESRVIFTWYRRQSGRFKTLKSVYKDGECWGQVGCSANYTPSVYDVGSVLRLEAIAVDNNGIVRSPLVVFVTSPTISQPERYHRCLIDYSSNNNFKYLRSIEEFKRVKGGLRSPNFSVLSYNILADLYVSTQKYYYCPDWARSWEYRRQNLLQEIMEYDADVICLQELQINHFEDFFKPQMEKFGYSVMYKSRAHRVYTADGYTIDGCAIFFRKSRFTLVQHYGVELSKFALPIIERFEPKKKTDGCFRLMKDNVAIAVVLEDNYDKLKSRVCIANTHIHSNPKLQDVKLLQVSNVIKGIERLASLEIPTIMCGDLNSSPNSDPHRLITQGKVEAPDKAADVMQIYRHLKLSHSMNMASAYEKLNEQLKEPVYTTITPRFRGALDYIFYTKSMLQVDGLLELLDDRTLEQMFLPSPLWSSDHIALMASFRLCGSSKKLHADSTLPVDIWE